MRPNKQTYFLSFLGLFLAQICLGQLVHEGNPFSWTMEENILETTNTISINAPNLAHILAMDANDELEKNKPFHFATALSLPASINLETSFGTWRTLVNGDRIWTIIITVPNAIGLGLYFDQYHLPKDAKLFIYNVDHSQLLGAYTQQDNNPSDKLVTLPISGDKIIIEYFEPFEKIGDGRISITKVNYQYRNFNGMDMNECSQNARCSTNIDYQLNSTIKIITANGTKLGTGVLINDADNDTPYILTSNQLNNGNPDTWSFIFNDYSLSCDNKNISDEYITSVGATIIANSEETGTMLLKLNETPTNNWNIYFSGWSRDIDVLETVFSLHFSEGDICQISKSLHTNQLEFSELYLKNITWDIGSISSGAVGAPLFNDQGLVVGIFTRGNIHCTDTLQTDTKADYFVLFSSLWNVYKTFLDPNNFNPISSEGKTPPVIAFNSKSITENAFQVYPIPTKGFLNIINTNEDIDISKIEVINIQGQLIKTVYPNSTRLQTLNLSNQQAGLFFLIIYSNQEIVRKAFILE